MTQPTIEPTIVTKQPKQKNPPSLTTLPSSPSKKSSKTAKKKNKTPTLCMFYPPSSPNSNSNQTQPSPTTSLSSRHLQYKQPRPTSTDPLTYQIKPMNCRTTIATETHQIRPTKSAHSPTKLDPSCLMTTIVKPPLCLLTTIAGP